MAQKYDIRPINKRRSRQKELVRASYVLDSSVIVASLIPSDSYYSQGSKIVQRLMDGSDIYYASAIVPIEVCAAVARRTRDGQMTEKVKIQLGNWVKLGRIRLAYLTEERMKKSQDIAIKYYLRGMDSIAVQVAEEKSIPIITFDHELADRISTRLKVITDDSIDEIP